MTQKHDDPFIDRDESPGERLARMNMEADLTLVSGLRRSRLDQGISIPEMASTLGISREKIIEWESQNDPRLSEVRRYAHALGLSISHSLTLLPFRTETASMASKDDMSKDEFQAQLQAARDRARVTE